MIATVEVLLANVTGPDCQAQLEQALAAIIMVAETVRDPYQAKKDVLRRLHEIYPNL